MTALSLVLLISGLLALVLGGEVLVRGAASLGRTLGLSPLIIGLTIVAFATSAPELAVTLDATLSGAPGLAIGNVVGSNVANILFVLGLTAVFSGLVVKVQLIKADIPIMIGFSLIALLMALDGQFSTGDGIILTGLLLLYVGGSVWYSRRFRVRGAESQLAMDSVLPGSPRGKIATALRASPLRSTAFDGALIAAGVLLLVVGARLLVAAATGIASALGVSDLIIGLTVVAIGTSLPELATSVIAAFRGERDMAVGNLVGSNIFNIGAALGITSIVSPAAVPISPEAIYFDLPFMLAVALVLMPLAFTGQMITRWEGLLLVAMYVVYVVYLVLSAGVAAAPEAFGAALLWFVIPVTAIWVVGLSSYLLKRRREADPSGI